MSDTHTSPDASSSSAAYTPRSDTAPALPPPRRGRKGHAKSRTGCRTCKRRKIKCDESKPECRNCIRFGVPCDFSPLSSTSIPSPTRRRGRPRSDWSSWPSPRSPSPSPPLDLPTLELFHAYLSSTGPLAGTPTIWRDAVPLLGLTHPCVLHAMLSLSAHHLARLQPLGAPRYLLLADTHYAAAVRGATALLPSLGPENCQALYVAAVLVCFTALARGPSPAGGDLLLVADGGVPWLTLMGGVRMVLQTVGTNVVLSGVLKPGEEDAIVPESLPGERFAWEMSLGRVRELLLLESDEARDMYSDAIKTLTVLLESAFGTEENPKHQESIFHEVMGWVYRLHGDFVEALESREAVSLLILGHFAMLLPSLEKRHWFINGWGSHVLREVKTLLGPTFDGWLP